MVLWKVMRKFATELRLGELPVTMAGFLTAYNQNMPASFPRASLGLLEKFKADHEALFIHGDTWSLEKHRKKLMDWLPRVTALARS